MFVKGHCSHSSRCGCFCRNWIFLSHFWAVGQYCHSKCSERKLRPREMRQLPWGQKDILWHKTAVSALPLGYAFSFHKISFMQKVFIQNLAGFQPAFWRSFCIVCSSVYFAVHYLRVFSYNLQNIFFLRLFFLLKPGCSPTLFIVSDLLPRTTSRAASDLAFYAKWGRGQFYALPFRSKHPFLAILMLLCQSMSVYLKSPMNSVLALFH